MHKDQQRRYRSIEALTRDIDHYLEGEPLEARPDSSRYRLDKFARRNWRPLSAALAAVVIVVSLVAFYATRLATARNVALAESACTQRIQRFMMNLFEGGDAEAGPADSLRVVTLVDRGLQEAQGLDRDPATQAELFATLGGIYQKLGNFGRADSLLRFALEERKSLLGPEIPDVAASLVALGSLRDSQAEYAEAERLIREGLAMSTRRLPPNDPTVLTETTALGQLLEDRGAYNEAIPVLERVVRLQSGGPSTHDLAASLTELANSHFYAGHYAISDTLNRRVLAMDRTLYGERHPHVRLGHVLVRERRFADAERESRVGYEILMKKASSSVSWIQMAREDLAIEYDSLSRPEMAARFRAELSR